MIKQKCVQSRKQINIHTFAFYDHEDHFLTAETLLFTFENADFIRGAISQCTSDIDNSVAKRSDTGKTVVYCRTRHLAGKLFLYFIH